MKAKKEQKALSKKEYAEVVVRPAERLLNALLEIEEKQRYTKSRKTAVAAIHR